MTLAGQPQSTRRLPLCGMHKILLFFVVGVAVAMTVAMMLGLTPIRSSVCLFHALTGWHCPGCGGTRAVRALLHGEWAEALHQHALFVLLLPTAAYAGTSFACRRFRGRHLPGGRWFERPHPYVALIALATAFFVARNLPWPPFDMLAPIPR